MLKYARLYIAGHRGLVGSAIVRALQAQGAPEPLVRGRDQLDLRDAAKVRAFFENERPDAVVLAAARVGGIQANATHPWEFLYDNLAIQINVLASALEADVQRVVFLGSSCIYPKNAVQPMRETALLSGSLEPTNEAYAVAKIAGLKLVEAATREFHRQWIALMPTNLYGPNDNFDLETAHVVPAMLRKFDEAKSRDRGHVVVWGDGSPRREFLHVDDLAAAALHVLDSDVTGVFNVGSGEEITLRNLARLIAEIVGYHGGIEWDSSRPNGAPRKLLDSTRMRACGWAPTIHLRDGLGTTYEWYRREVSKARGLSVNRSLRTSAAT